jgi:methylated-DNA-protein-cysteine methyltransferase related protein
VCSDARTLSGPFAERAEAVIRKLRPGEVVTYGEVAADAGRPGAARAVGHLLATRPADLPWWRVVTAAGRLVPGHEAEHARRLAAEGVAVVDGRVRLRGATSSASE